MTLDHGKIQTTAWTISPAHRREWCQVAQKSAKYTIVWEKLSRLWCSGIQNTRPSICTADNNRIAIHCEHHRHWQVHSWINMDWNSMSERSVRERIPIKSVEKVRDNHRPLIGTHWRSTSSQMFSSNRQVRRPIKFTWTVYVEWFSTLLLWIWCPSNCENISWKPIV